MAIQSLSNPWVRYVTNNYTYSPKTLVYNGNYISYMIKSKQLFYIFRLNNTFNKFHNLYGKIICLNILIMSHFFKYLSINWPNTGTHAAIVF